VSLFNVDSNDIFNFSIDFMPLLWKFITLTIHERKLKTENAFLKKNIMNKEKVFNPCIEKIQLYYLPIISLT